MQWHVLTARLQECMVLHIVELHVIFIWILWNKICNMRRDGRSNCFDFGGFWQVAENTSAVLAVHLAASADSECSDTAEVSWLYSWLFPGYFQTCRRFTQENKRNKGHIGDFLVSLLLTWWYKLHLLLLWGFSGHMFGQRKMCLGSDPFGFSSLSKFLGAFSWSMKDSLWGHGNRRAVLGLGWFRCNYRKIHRRATFQAAISSPWFPCGAMGASILKVYLKAKNIAGERMFILHHRLLEPSASWD